MLSETPIDARKCYVMYDSRLCKKQFRIFFYANTQKINRE